LLTSITTIGVAIPPQSSTRWWAPQALRSCLEQWLGRKLTRTCGSDEASQRRYRDSLTAAGFDVHALCVEYIDELDLDQIVGGIYSAIPVDRLPAPDQRPRFAELVRRALAPHAPFNEHVRVAMLIGRLGE
jgi:hypothetical protein